MTHSLQFALTCVARSKGRSRTSFVTRIFQLCELEQEDKVYYKTGRTPSELLDKYFFQFYPYPSPKDRVKGAIRPRAFCLKTDVSFRDNIRRLASMHGMTVNEFMVGTLTQKMANEIKNDPMLLRKNIPYY